MGSEARIRRGLEYAAEVYGALGVDVEAAMEAADGAALSMHCWQGDDVAGFDGADSLGGGLAVTGGYPGRARNFEELTRDIAQALRLVPGRTKLNLHACYAVKNCRAVDRDAYTLAEFEPWLAFAREKGLGLDFNPTFFSHPMMDGNLSLSSPDEGRRRFWVEHGKRCREIGAAFAAALGQPCVVNFWMPDGSKDRCVNTLAFRERMTASLDEIFADRGGLQAAPCALESKLFGVGVESFTVVSHEYALGYAMRNGLTACLDTGHFHPTEMVSAKVTAVLGFVPSLLLHLSRPVRWDSDHVVILEEELQQILDEIVWNGLLPRVYLGLDFFDASINRVAAWVIGLRNARKALLGAFLAPVHALFEAEAAGDHTRRLALLEERKTLPLGAVWDAYCLRRGVPPDGEWLAEVRRYEARELAGRG